MMRRREEKPSQSIVVNSGNYMIHFPKEQQVCVGWAADGIVKDLPNIVFHGSLTHQHDY